MPTYKAPPTRKETPERAASLEGRMNTEGGLRWNLENVPVQKQWELESLLMLVTKTQRIYQSNDAFNLKSSLFVCLSVSPFPPLSPLYPHNQFTKWW